MFHASKQVMHMNALTICHRSLGQHRGGNCVSHVFTDVAAQDTTAPGLLPEMGCASQGLSAHCRLGTLRRQCDCQEASPTHALQLAVRLAAAAAGRRPISGADPGQPIGQGRPGALLLIAPPAAPALPVLLLLVPLALLPLGALILLISLPKQAPIHCQGFCQETLLH